jgi:hypothetical protein
MSMCKDDTVPTGKYVRIDFGRASRSTKSAEIQRTTVSAGTGTVQGNAWRWQNSARLRERSRTAGARRARGPWPDEQIGCHGRRTAPPWLELEQLAIEQRSRQWFRS